MRRQPKPGDRPDPEPRRPGRGVNEPLPDVDDEVIDLEAAAAEADAIAGEAEAVGEGDADAEALLGEGAARRRIVVTKDVKKRLDVYLHDKLKGISRSKIQRLIDLGGVTVNDTVPKASTKLGTGDVIEIILPPQGVSRIEPEPIPIHVLYEDDHFIVINKQANLIVHPARSHKSGTLLNGLAYRFKQQVEAEGGVYRDRQTRGFVEKNKLSKEEEGAIAGLSGVGAREFRPGIIHRLDKNTTGVMVVAKNDEAHWAIARQFEDRSTLKCYMALVHGNFDTVGGAIEAPIGKHPTIREAMAVRHDSSGKHALTLFRVREQYRGFTLIELELKTGRTHQIRVHLSYLGHPIVGDLLYGGEALGTSDLDNPPTPLGVRPYLNFARDKDAGQRAEAEALQRPDLILTHPALHATLLQIRHPVTSERVTFTAPLHQPMLGLVQQLRQRPTDRAVVTSGYWVDLNQAIPESP